MRESTRRGLEFVKECMTAAEKELTADGFKYHSGRTWVGLTTDGDVVTVTVDKKETAPPEIKIFRAEAGETFDPGAVTGKKPKKGKPKDGG